MSAPTLLTPYGYSSSTCGYCSPQGQRSSKPSSKKYGLEAPQMSVSFYQSMIDRGWRRSGDYVYHPDMARTCCPQYTIRLNTNQFKTNKKHRQVINRFNRFLKTGCKPGEDVSRLGGRNDHQMPKRGGKGKGKKTEGSGEIFGFRQELVEAERMEGLAHHYETVLVPAKATPETYDLYRRYQISVHGDEPEKVTMRGFSRFLCSSPLLCQLPPPLPFNITVYKVDDKIIGISVIDILPSCVSSVYFIWDPDWAWASLGKLSALREIALVLEMKEHGVQGMDWLYMGYWIPDCVKMRYKSEYSPSYLLDPATRDFHLLTPKVDSFLQAHPKGYFAFQQIESSDPAINKADSSGPSPTEKKPEENEEDDEIEDVEEMDEFPSPPPPGFEDPNSIPQGKIDNLLVFMRSSSTGRRKGPQLVRVEDLQFVNPLLMEKRLRELVAAVGVDLMADADGDVDVLRDKGILSFT